MIRELSAAGGKKQAIATGVPSTIHRTERPSSILARAECADGDRLAAVARLHELVSECDFETLSARARANLERAAHDIGFALERPPQRQAVHLHESS